MTDPILVREVSSAPAGVSLIIPTWNEAGWLPRLLRSARAIPQIRQTIVADKDSLDGTAEIATAEHCTLVPGGRPSAARNHGAAAATERIVLFVDADCVLTPGAVRAAVDALAVPGVVGLHIRTIPVSLGWYCWLSYWLMDVYIRALATFGVVQGVASFIAVRREAFEACGGFDERVSVGEDADFLRRLSRLGAVRYCPDEIVFTSARRFHTERPWLFSAKVVLWAALRLLHLKRSIVNYRWDGHARSAVDEEYALRELMRRYTAVPSDEPLFAVGLGEGVGVGVGVGETVERPLVSDSLLTQ